jgi:hypothetical protein
MSIPYPLKKWGSEASSGGYPCFGHCHPKFRRYVVKVQSGERLCWQAALLCGTNQDVTALLFFVAFHDSCADCPKATLIKTKQRVFHGIPDHFVLDQRILIYRP